jgi:4'-phosphopantetheinyl transferase
VREIAVWTVALDGLPTGGGLLDDEERDRWRRLRTAGLRDAFAAAHWARRIVLARTLGVDPGGLRFASGRWGKPDLVEGRLFHSLSHSGRIAMVAVSPDAPVGVDVEQVRPGLPAVRLAGTFFRPAEAGWVQAAADPAARYIRLWTRKEAAGKVTGICLDRSLRIDVGGDPGVQVAGRSGGRPLPVVLEQIDGRPAAAAVVDIDAPAGFLAAAAMLGREPFGVRMREFAAVPA